MRDGGHLQTTSFAQRLFLDVIGERPFTDWTNRST
jgi:hypothetical protein